MSFHSKKRKVLLTIVALGGKLPLIRRCNQSKTRGYRGKGICHAILCSKKTIRFATYTCQACMAFVCRVASMCRLCMGGVVRLWLVFVTEEQRDSRGCQQSGRYHVNTCCGCVGITGNIHACRTVSLCGAKRCDHRLLGRITCAAFFFYRVDGELV